MRFVQSASTHLLEPVTVPEIICSALGRIEFMGGGQSCFVLYRNTISASGADEQQICGRVYAPLAAVPEAVELMLRAMLEGEVVEAVKLSARLLS